MPEARRALFDAHLEGCATCRAEFARFSAVWDALDSYGRMPAVELPPDFHRELLARIEREQIERVVRGEMAWRERVGRVLFGRRSWKVALTTTCAAVLIALGIYFLPRLNDVTQLNPGGAKLTVPRDVPANVDLTGRPEKRATPEPSGVTTGATAPADLEIGAAYGDLVPALVLRNKGPALTTDVRIGVVEVFLGPGRSYRSVGAERALWVGDAPQNEARRIPVDVAALLPAGHRLAGGEAMWLTIRWTSEGQESVRHVFMPARRPESGGYGQVNMSGDLRVADVLAGIAGQAGVTLIAPSVPEARMETNLSAADLWTAIGALTRTHYRGYEDFGQVVELK
jgi:hypothetical protein